MSIIIELTGKKIDKGTKNLHTHVPAIQEIYHLGLVQEFLTFHTHNIP